MSPESSTEPLSVLMVVEQLRRSVPGGIGTYIRGLLGGLAKLEETASRSGQPPRCSVLLHASRRHPDPLVGLGLLSSVPLPSPVLTRAWDLGVLRAPDGCEVIHGTSLATPSRPRRSRTPLVVMVHDLLWRSYPQATTRRGHLWHERALGRALKRADAFITPSQAVATQLIAAGAPAGTVTVITEGADHLPRPDEPGAEAVLAASGVLGPYLLSVATLEPRKNLARLLQAYRAARSEMAEPIPLVIAGPLGWGETGLDEHLDGVVAIGHVEGAVLSGLYAGATAFVYVPLAEGFGLPPLEAMIEGTPVVASATVPSVAEAAEPPALLVDPFDVDQMAQALVSVVADGDQSRMLATRGSVYAGTKSWEASAVDHLALWRRLV